MKEVVLYEILMKTPRDSVRVHSLKVLPPYFMQIVGEEKSFELRKFDRDYRIGDVLWLREWENEKYTGNDARYEIIGLTNDVPQFGLQEGYCILSLRLDNWLTDVWVRWVNKDWLGVLEDNKDVPRVGKDFGIKDDFVLVRFDGEKDSIPCYAVDLKIERVAALKIWREKIIEPKK